LAGCAVYSEWEKGKQLPDYCGYAIAVDTDLDEKTKFWVALMRLGAKTGCHQMNERSFSFKSYQFPLCARCTGLLIGQITALCLFMLFRQFDIKLLLFPALVSVTVLGIDGIGQLKELWLSTNMRRLFTGLFCGFFVTIFIANCIIKLIAVYTGP
jgi:uncharacterized membrane protein